MTSAKYLLVRFRVLGQHNRRRGRTVRPLEPALPCPVQGGHRPAQRTLDGTRQAHTLTRAGLATTSGGSTRARPAARTSPPSGRSEGWAQRLISGPRSRSWRWGDGPTGGRPSRCRAFTHSRTTGVSRTKRAIWADNARSSRRSDEPSARAMCAHRADSSSGDLPFRRRG